MLFFTLEKYQKKNHIDKKHNSKVPIHQPIDLEEKPLLYEYYANTLNPIIDKRNFDEIDRLGMDRLNKRFFLERPKPAQYEQQQQTQPQSQQQPQRFREVDRSDYHDFVKRMLNDDRVIRPLNREQLSKRNFDEIDRFGPDVFVDSKRSMFHGGESSEEDEPNNKLKYSIQK